LKGNLKSHMKVHMEAKWFDWLTDQLRGWDVIWRPSRRRYSASIETWGWLAKWNGNSGKGRSFT
jgi:hypothetical protein